MTKIDALSDLLCFQHLFKELLLPTYFCVSNYDTSAIISKKETERCYACLKVYYRFMLWLEKKVFNSADALTIIFRKRQLLQT